MFNGKRSLVVWLPLPAIICFYFRVLRQLMFVNLKVLVFVSLSLSPSLSLCVCVYAVAWRYFIWHSGDKALSFTYNISKCGSPLIQTASAYTHTPKVGNIYFDNSDKRMHCHFKWLQNKFFAFWQCELYQCALFWEFGFTTQVKVFLALTRTHSHDTRVHFSPNHSKHKHSVIRSCCDFAVRRQTDRFIDRTFAISQPIWITASTFLHWKPDEEKSTHGKRHIIQLYVNKLNQSWRLTVNSNTSRGQMKKKIVCVLCRWEKPNENSVGVWTEKKMSQIVEWSWRDNENKCKWTAAAKSRTFHVLGCILGEWGESKMFRFLIESRPVVWHGSLDYVVYHKWLVKINTSPPHY